jgi:Tol biopolymer transport system component
MPNRRIAPFSCFVTCLVFAGCGETASGPETGSISLQVETRGKRPDPDGYLVSVDGNAALAVPANGTAQFHALPAGEHTLAVSGAMWNCTLSQTTFNVQVRSDERTNVSLLVHCPRVLSNELVFATEQYGFSELAAMRPDGTGRERITTDQLVNTSPSVSPDGRSIAFSSRRGDRWSLYVMDVDATTIREIGRSAFDGNAAWSPNGARIAFRSELPGPYGEYGRIWVVNADGTGLRQVSPETADYTYDAQPTWSPDGTRIVFTRSGKLYIINADGTNLVNIHPCPLPCDDPAWSPDGQRIAFGMLTDDDGIPGNAQMDVYIMNMVGGDVVRISTDPAQEEEPTWSPDGTEIVYSRVVNGKFQLYRVRASAGNASVLLSTSQASDYAASWVRSQ